MATRSITSTRITGNSVPRLTYILGGEVIRMRGEKLLMMPYRKGLGVYYTFGRTGDYVFEDGRAYICIPKELEDEFSDGWLHRKNDDSIEPFVTYYEQFAAKHADKIIQPTWFVKLITLLP